MGGGEGGRAGGREELGLGGWGGGGGQGQGQGACTAAEERDNREKVKPGLS